MKLYSFLRNRLNIHIVLENSDSPLHFRQSNLKQKTVINCRFLFEKKTGNLTALKTWFHCQSSQHFQSQNIYFQNKMGKYDIQQQIRKDKDSIWAKVKCICGLYQAYVSYLPRNLRLILKPTIPVQLILHRVHIPSFSSILQTNSFLLFCPSPDRAGMVQFC